jgi:hypothetical protein
MSTVGTAGYKDAVGKLRELADDLGARGFATTLVTGGQTPSLTVVNKDATHLSDTIYAATGRDTSWWLWWSWSQRISPVADTAAAVDIIARVLAAR